MRIVGVILMNDSSHFNYLYAYIITFCRFWHTTREILNLPLKYLTAHFMINYFILSNFPPYFLRNVSISPGSFQSQREKKSTFVFLGTLCFLLENLEGKCPVLFSEGNVMDDLSQDI